MTKSKPTYLLSTQAQKSHTTTQRTVVDSSCQTSQELLSRSPILSPDFSADRYDNGLRTVHITSADGRKRVHKYRARAPVNLMSGMPSALAYKATTPTVESREASQQLDDRTKVLILRKMLDSVPPAVLEMSSQEQRGNGEYTRPATPILETVTPIAPPASPEIDSANNASIVPQRRNQNALYHWCIAVESQCVALMPTLLHGARHMLMPFLLSLVLPSPLWKFLVVPWVVFKGLKTVARKSKMGVLGYALFVLVLVLGVRLEGAVLWELRGVLNLGVCMVRWLLSAMLKIVWAWVVSKMCLW